MRITSKISHYHKGILALVLAPFLWLQMYFHALQDWLIDMLYNELFRINKISYSQTTHFLAFLCFSAFSLLAYHKHLDQYISLILYVLWLINYFSTKFRIGLYVDNPAWVSLETKEQHWQWSLLAKKQHQAQHNFAYDQIKCVLIAATTYGDDSFKNQVLKIWHVHIQSKDDRQWVVYQDADIQQALTKAVKLAEQLNTVVKIAESYGTGTLAEFELAALQNQRRVAWKRAFISDTIRIHKSFSTVSIFRWLAAIFAELGDFLFIAILSGFMQRYGALLLLGFGDNLGLKTPTFETVQFNTSGAWGIFSPDFDWILLTVFAVTMVALFHSIYKQSRKYEILLNHKRVQYRVSGNTKASLTLTGCPDVILLKGFDKTSLIIVNEQYKVLEIKDLEEDEYAELYNMLLTA